MVCYEMSQLSNARFYKCILQTQPWQFIVDEFSEGILKKNLFAPWPASCKINLFEASYGDYLGRPKLTLSRVRHLVFFPISLAWKFFVDIFSLLFFFSSIFLAYRICLTSKILATCKAG